MPLPANAVPAMPYSAKSALASVSFALARSQFRGTLKRRAYVVRADGPVTAGEEVFAGSDSEQPAGTVVQSAASPSGEWSAIISMQIAALEAGGLRAGGPAGVALILDPLPYPLLADI